MKGVGKQANDLTKQLSQQQYMAELSTKLKCGLYRVENNVIRYNKSFLLEHKGSTSDIVTYAIQNIQQNKFYAKTDEYLAVRA